MMFGVFSRSAAILVALLAASWLNTAQAQTSTWRGPGGEAGLSGNWGVASNWIGGIPSSGEALLPQLANPYTVSVTDFQNAGLINITGSNATLTQTGTLNVQSSNFNVDAGTYNLQGGLLDYRPTGEFGAFTLGNGAAFNWSGGNFLSNRPINFNGTTTASGGSKDFQGTAAVGGTGTFTITGGTIRSVNAASGFSVSSGGLVNIQTDGTIFQTGTAAGTLTNSGTVRKSVGTGTSTVQWGLSNSGTIDVQTGTLAFTNGGTLNGTNASGAGALNLSGGTFTTTGTFNNNGTVNLTAGGYTVAATGTANVNGRFNINASAITSSGAGAAVNIGTNGVLDIRTNDNALVNTTGVRALTNNGILQKSAGTGNSVVQWATTTNNGGLIDVQTGTLQFTNGLTMNSGSFLQVRMLGTSTNTEITNVNVAATGATTIQGGARLQIDLNGIDALALRESIGTYSTRSYTVLTASGGLTGDYSATGALEIKGAAEFSDPAFWTITAGVSGNNIVLNFTPVPEPATVLAIGAAGLGLAGWRRRRNATAKAAV